LPTLFSMSRMHWKAWLIFIGLAFVAYWALKLTTLATSKVWDFIRDVHNNRIQKKRA